MKAMMKKPAVKKPAMKKFAAGGAVAKKKPVKKYALGGGIPNTGVQASPDMDMAAKQKQLMAQQAEMLKGTRAAPSQYMPSAGTGAPIVDSREQQLRNQQFQQQTRDKAMAARDVSAGSFGDSFGSGEGFGSAPVRRGMQQRAQPRAEMQTAQAGRGRTMMAKGGAVKRKKK